MGFKNLAMVGANHFNNQFKEDDITSVSHMNKLTTYLSFVNEDQNAVFMEEVTLEEVKKVVHSLQKDKILRLDSYFVEFFKGFMDIFEQYLHEVIEQSRLNARILTAFKSTFIALIPKVDNVSGRNTSLYHFVIVYIR